MEKIIGKGILKKLIVVLIAITLFNAIIPPKVAYADEKDVVTSVGGTLLSPVASLMIGLGDAVMNLIHDLIYNMDTSLILISKDNKAWGIFWTVVATVVAIVVIAVLAYYTAGAALTLLAKLGIVAAGAAIPASAIGTIMTVSLIGGAIAGTLTAEAWFGNNIVFPIYQVTPEEIFKGEVGMLDVNFFKKEEKVEDKDIEVETALIINKESLLENPVTIKYDLHGGGLKIGNLTEGMDYFNEVLKKHGYKGEYIDCSVGTLTQER